MKQLIVWVIMIMLMPFTVGYFLPPHRGQNGPQTTPDPDSQIVFTSSRDDNLEIYVMTADGSDPRNLTQNEANDSDSSWLPASN